MNKSNIVLISLICFSLLFVSGCVTEPHDIAVPGLVGSAMFYLISYLAIMLIVKSINKKSQEKVGYPSIYWIFLIICIVLIVLIVGALNFIPGPVMPTEPGMLSQEQIFLNNLNSLPNSLLLGNLGVLVIAGPTIFLLSLILGNLISSKKLKVLPLILTLIYAASLFLVLLFEKTGWKFLADTSWIVLWLWAWYGLIPLAILGIIVWRIKRGKKKTL